MLNTVKSKKRLILVNRGLDFNLNHKKHKDKIDLILKDWENIRTNISNNTIQKKGDSTIPSFRRVIKRLKIILTLVVNL